ncbi:hypothetical protein [uncultured Hyphomicrobium sp.]|uniref:hypothetical protein n=1 Tax=uncultured Hyphomicrobium sp. TaxID=194373 RepID=UPI0025CF5499|nr:hypothetical protein [uncultured Hyphomicrobium sp.]
MRVYYELANFLVASWRLARAGEKLPTSHGVLDRALEKAQAELPERFKGTLTFVDTPIGRLCSELPDILRAAQESYLTSEPNPTYRTAEVKVGAAAAMDLLDDLSIDIEVGKGFGSLLAELVKKEAEQFRTSRAA